MENSGKGRASGLVAHPARELAGRVHGDAEVFL